jgi:pseudaminic acid synthase
VFIKKRKIGQGEPCYIIAEVSANHNGKIEDAKKIIELAKEAGADCVKVQTYTADTITMNCHNDYFLLKEGTWKGKNLHDLYTDASMPWEWQGELKQYADQIGIDFFSTPFDATAVDFLESIQVEFYKIASFEIIDIPLIEKVAQTGKPIILSVGMASLGEIEEAVATIRKYGNEFALLKCSSAYPAVPENMNLRTIPNMKELFEVPVGLSDHSMGSVSAIVAVSLGANLIEKHICISRTIEGPDSSFSMEPEEFKQMVADVRIAEKTLGRISYQVTEHEKSNYMSRKSIFVTSDIKKGEMINSNNIRVIRPGYGMEPKHYDTVIGQVALKDLKRGTPLSQKDIGEV